jgi:LDH2 family malate/lactate/ureidoglycolate dehydrogenase
MTDVITLHALQGDGKGRRTVSMVLLRLADDTRAAYPVEAMFDRDGEETGDPLEAVEVLSEGVLMRLAPGDALHVEVEIDE